MTRQSAEQQQSSKDCQNFDDVEIGFVKMSAFTDIYTVGFLQDDMDLKALGFDIAEGVNDPYLPGDCGIFVTRVDKGSIADGRLRYAARSCPVPLFSGPTVLSSASSSTLFVFPG